MSLHDFWSSSQNRRILRSSTRNTLQTNAAEAVDNMADADDTDALVNKISEAVFAKLSASLDAKLDQILKSVSSVVEKVKVVEQRVDDTEKRISDMEDVVTALKVQLDETVKRLDDATASLDSHENRSRRNNIKLVNLPERMETDNPREFIETWLPKVLNLTVKNGRIKVDRIHRTPAQRRPDSTRPRLVYIRLHNFADKQKIMQRARSMGEITVNGSRIHIFEDFSQAVEKRRREFSEVKKSLKDLGAEYSLLFPATLRVSHANKTQFFKTVDEAKRYVEELQNA